MILVHKVKTVDDLLKIETALRYIVNVVLVRVRISNWEPLLLSHLLHDPQVYFLVIFLFLSLSIIAPKTWLSWGSEWVPFLLVHFFYLEFGSNDCTHRHWVIIFHTLPKLALEYALHGPWCCFPEFIFKWENTHFISKITGIVNFAIQLYDMETLLEAHIEVGSSLQWSHEQGPSYVWILWAKFEESLGI